MHVWILHPQAVILSSLHQGDPSQVLLQSSLEAHIYCSIFSSFLITHEPTSPLIRPSPSRSSSLRHHPPTYP